MGSYDFQNIERNANAEAAFSNARDQAAFEYGHCGYTGTIAEKDSFTIIQRTPLTAEDAEALAARLMREDDPRISDKWGPAGAIPVVFATREEQITIPEVTVDTSDHTAEQASLAEAALEVLRRKRLLRRGEKVTSVEVTMYSTDRQPIYAGGYYGGGWRNTKERRTNLRATVTLAKPKSKTTRAAAAQQDAEGWLFFGYAPS